MSTTIRLQPIPMSQAHLAQTQERLRLVEVNLRQEIETQTAIATRTLTETLTGIALA